MPRLALKPDSSFFRKIATGVCGARGVCADLSRFGHDLVELERGSLDTKLWKDVKRKRVRIPDLVCKKCGLRVECRTKTKRDLSMSHSAGDAARAWDFGMVDTDCVAFPVCEAGQEQSWTSGRMGTDSSYWHERNWVRWQLNSPITYFRVGAFRAAPFTKTRAKGVTEGSETIISWDGAFSSRTGRIEAVEGQRITIRRTSDGHVRTAGVPEALKIWVKTGDTVEVGQLLASTVVPIIGTELACPGHLPDRHIERLLSSRERTQRFTGIKLARLRKETEFVPPIRDLASDKEEDIYIRLEGASYLAAVPSASELELFGGFLSSSDPQVQLETVITLGETQTPGAVELLCRILDDASPPYFLRSAAAWCLSQASGDQATNRLVRAFSDVDATIREEALHGLVSIGGPAWPVLLAGLNEMDHSIAAGCAETLRQQYPLDENVVADLMKALESGQPSPWTVWLAGQLPRERVATSIASLQNTAPQLHYAISLLWSFIESWIARRWELRPTAIFPENTHAV